MSLQQGEGQCMEASHFQKLQVVDFNLTPEQYLILQHYLPKRYSLIDHKNIKKGVVVTSAVKLGYDQPQNISRMSGNGTVQRSQDIDGRSKRIRVKKVDKFLEDQPQKSRKQQLEVSAEDELSQCNYILTNLKKHRSAFPFLVPVDPKRDGVLNYFQIIKEPMDLETVQKNLTQGLYVSASQFHAHICKIWSNSYLYNQKNSLVYKLAVDMQRYYKSLLNSEGYKKGVKTDKSKREKDKKDQTLTKHQTVSYNKDYSYGDMQ